jgi:hypothetical protein
MGLEPTTTRSTIWCSAIELLAPHIGEKEAGGQGFEPRLTDPKSAVLPLDDPPVMETVNAQFKKH